MEALFRTHWTLLGVIGIGLLTGSLAAQSLVYPFGSTQQANLPPVTVPSLLSRDRQFVVYNPGQESALVVVEVGNLPDTIKLYRERGNRLELLDLTGQLTATLPRPDFQVSFIQSRNLVLFRVAPGESAAFRLRLTNRTRVYPKTFPIRLFTTTAYRAQEALWLYETEHRQRLVGSFFLGVIGVMFLFTSLQYALLREPLFLYYALYLLLVLFRILLANESIIVDNWPLLHHIGFVGRFSLVMVFWSFAAYTLFLRAYISLDSRAPRLSRLLRGIGWALFGLGVFDLFVTIQRLYSPGWITTYRYIEVGLLGFGLFNLWLLWRFYDHLVKYIFWGIVLFFVGGLASLINQRYMDTPDAHFREILIWLGAYVAELLAFSLGIVKRQQLIEQEKIQLQAQFIHQLQENQRRQQQLQQIRADIARDLHDELGSELSGISILSQVAMGRLTQQPAQAQTALATIGETAHQVMERMRDIVWSLSINQAQTDDVSGRLEAITNSMLEHTGIRAEFDIPVTLPMYLLSPLQWRNLSMLYKEALHNVVKHARATQITIRLVVDNNTVHLRIQDNGTGFSMANNRSGNGLSNQRHRAATLKGTVTIESQLGRGTRVTLQFPVQAAQSVHQAVPS